MSLKETMKPKLLTILFVLICANSWLHSTLWEIKQDGTGNFTTIQQGIDTSVDADTVLVFPGTYLENINYNGKSIVVGSLNLTTGDEQYILQTIIDGNQNGSCIQIMSDEDSTTTIFGFSITNGSGTVDPYYEMGGGIYIDHSNLKVVNCYIYRNFAYGGGGIYFDFSHLDISGTKIFNNHSTAGGGGIAILRNSTIIFDTNNLCDIYLNYSAKGNDIFKNFLSPPVLVNVDTFTVTESSLYFINSTSSTGVPLNDVILNANHAKIEQVYCDLYVSESGVNTNSGLTVDDPLKTLNYALALLSDESTEIYTVNVANGTYSKNLNQQCFPLNMPGNISIIGESMDSVLWDAQEQCMFINDENAKASYIIKNISFINGREISSASAIRIDTDTMPEPCVSFENLFFTGCIRDNGFIIFVSSLKTRFLNVSSIDNESGFVRFHRCSTNDPVIEMENIKIINNHELIVSDQTPFYQMKFDANFNGPMSVIMKNVEISDNVRYTYNPEYLTTAVIKVVVEVDLYLINATIGNNIVPLGADGGTIFIQEMDNNVHIYNSILYGDNPHEIYLYNFNDPNHYSSVTVSHSLVEGGAAGIQNPYSWNQVDWLEGNIDEDPLWLDTGDNPYYLQSVSPCIDAGTSDLPEGIELPEYDLAGNPRIYGNIIDMGAYEWQGVGIEDEEIPQLSPFKTQISNYPNPFNPSTTIKLELADAGKIELAIFNVKGQKVKTLIDAFTNKGTFETNWNGEDEKGKSVSNGQYVVKLQQNGKETATKIMLLK